MSVASVTTPEGATIRWRVHGRTPPEVVLLHGWMATSSVWDRLIPLLPVGSSSGGPTPGVAAVDLRGVGASTRGTAPLSLELLADDVCRVLDGLGRVHLVGHSMGGQLAQVVAARRPGALRTLALINPVPVGGIALPDPVVTWFREAGEDADALGRVLDAGCNELDAEGREALLAAALTIPRQTIAEGFELFRRGLPDAQIHAIDVPTVALATDDPFLPSAVLQAAVVDRIASSRLATLPGPGHYPQVERPPAVAALLRELWASVE